MGTENVARTDSGVVMGETRRAGWNDSDPFEADEHLNEIGSRLFERATAIAHLVEGARDAIGMANPRGPDPLAEQFGGAVLTAQSAMEAAIALAETIRSDAETLQSFEIPKLEARRTA